MEKHRSELHVLILDGTVLSVSGSAPTPRRDQGRLHTASPGLFLVFTILFVVSEARSRAFDHAYVPTSTVSPVLELTLL